MIDLSFKHISFWILTTETKYLKSNNNKNNNINIVPFVEDIL